MRIRTLLSLLAVPATFLAAGPLQAAAAANQAVTISQDPFVAPTPGQHATEVEPDILSVNGATVAAFQVGRFSDGGSTSLGWASWTTSPPGQNGLVPGVTTNDNPAGPFDRETDPSVGFNAKFGVWLISGLAMTGTSGAAVVVNRSTDGISWSLPFTITQPPGGGLDKPWIACDNHTGSSHYGNCYETWDDNGAGDVIYMSTSTDGGQTWSAPVTPSGSPTGLGGQPQIQPSGTVIVPGMNAFGNQIIAWKSTNGGTSWSSAVKVSSIRQHTIAASLRSDPLPSSNIDAGGKVYTTWHDCRFETNCTANDIVMSTSSDGTTWSAVTRIPADAVGSGVDHFIPGLGVDSNTQGATAHLALTYYYYPNASCTVSTCQLDTGITTSSNGGTTWSRATQVGGPLNVTWLANTTQGYMVGDYIATTYATQGIEPVFAQAQAPNGSVLNEYMVSGQGGHAQGGSIPAQVWKGGALPAGAPSPVAPIYIP